MLVHLEGFDLHYECVGAGRPMLMLHGGYLDHRHMMEEMEPAFADHSGWLRLYPDLPGHGRTGVAEGMINHDHILAAVLAFVEAVLPGQHYAASGMSVGGHLVRGLVRRCPERLLGVMFNGTPFVTDYAERTVPVPVALRQEAGFADAAGPALGTLQFLQPVHDLAIAAWHQRNMAPARALLQESFALKSWEPEHYAYSFDLAPPAPFPGPSLILCGRQDPVAGYRDAWPSVEDYPRASFAVLDLGGHLIAPARPELFRALVADWLERMETESA
jgi:pimeloyl-ACP methyl ester carboxylesterase